MIYMVAKKVVIPARISVLAVVWLADSLNTLSNIWLSNAVSLHLV